MGTVFVVAGLGVALSELFFTVLDFMVLPWLGWDSGSFPATVAHAVGHGLPALIIYFALVSKDLLPGNRSPLLVTFITCAMIALAAWLTRDLNWAKGRVQHGKTRRTVGRKELVYFACTAAGAGVGILFGKRTAPSGKTVHRKLP